MKVQQALKEKLIPKTSGVYFIWYKNTIIYIGQSKNLYNRIKNHFREEKITEYNNKLQNETNKDWIPAKILAYSRYNFFQIYRDDLEISYIELEAEKLNNFEEKAISKYKPIFNYAGVHTKFKPVKI